MASGEADLRSHVSCRGKDQMAASCGVRLGAARDTAADVTATATPSPGCSAQPDDAEELFCCPDERLSDAMLSVGHFHQAFNLPRASRPGAGVPVGLAQLRVDLLVEEVGEFADATAESDLVAMADALADIVYVAYGAAVTYGIDLDAALREVHRSNMSKLDEHGRPIYREDGKVLKSARYTPPDIPRVLSVQLPLPF